MMRCGSRIALPLAVLCTWILASPARAQLPKAEDILEKFIVATGGKAAQEKCKSRVMKGTLDVAGQNLKGEITIYQAAPAKMYTEVEIANVGKIQDGVSGGVAWSVTPFAGPRVKEGEEKQSALQQADFYGDLNWQKYYKKAECVGEETIDGKACYKVKLTGKNDRVRTNYYDQASNLLVHTKGTEISQGNEIETESSVSDYKKFGDILIPCKLRQKQLEPNSSSRSRKSTTT